MVKAWPGWWPSEASGICGSGSQPPDSRGGGYTLIHSHFRSQSLPLTIPVVLLADQRGEVTVPDAGTSQITIVAGHSHKHFDTIIKTFDSVHSQSRLQTREVTLS